MPTKAPDLRCGVYEHYKGRFYLLMGVAHHSETDERLVVYVPLYTRGGPRLAVRPLSMWDERVRWPDGTLGPRFRFVGVEFPNAGG